MYYKCVEDGYIIAVGTSNAGEGGISKAEYDEIMDAINSKPEFSEGFDGKLRTDLTWETVVMPVIEEELSDEEAVLEILKSIS